MNARLLPSLLVASSFLTANLSAAQGAAGTEERVTRSAAGPVGDHAVDELRDPASFEVIRREPAEITVKPRRAIGKDKGTDALKATYGDSWVYEATTDIFSDRDGDGYFSYLRVQFDADTIYTYSWVYAEIYISADGTAWEHLYSTRDFDYLGLRSRRRLRSRDRARLRLLDGPLRCVDRALRRRHGRARRRVRAERVAGVLAVAARRLGARRCARPAARLRRRRRRRRRRLVARSRRPARRTGAAPPAAVA